MTSNTIDKLKFSIAPTNQAMALMNSGFVPNGEAHKNGWEEVKDITNNIKVAITELYQTVMGMARDVVNVGGGNEAIIMNIYRTIPEDVKITADTLISIDKKYSNKTGFFKGNDSIDAQQIILDYHSVFEKVHVLTASMVVEIQEVLLRYTRKPDSGLTDPNVITDVEVKTV